MRSPREFRRAQVLIIFRAQVTLVRQCTPQHGGGFFPEQPYDDLQVAETGM
jgi:hypothetical protein